MKKIILLTHGDWGQSLIKVVKEQFGTNDELIHYGIDSDDDYDDFVSKIKENLVNIDQEMFFLSDLEGSSTFRAATKLALLTNGKSYTDLSLRLILDIMNNNIEELEEITEKFKEFESEVVTMEEIKFARVDHRLIHGQVITKWMKLIQANKIVIIDDSLGKDPFMADIYRMAAPAGVEVEILDTVQSVEKFNNGTFKNDKVFLLFRNIQMVKNAVENGLQLSSLQLGGIPYEKGKTKVVSAVSLLPQEVDFLESLNNSGVEVVAQIVPEESSVSFSEIKSKF